MKRSITAVALLAAAISVSIGDAAMSPINQKWISFSLDGKAIVVQLENNPTAQSLWEMLPLTLDFQDFAGTEKISYLSDKLDLGGAPDGYDPTPGDLTLYAPWGNLAFFHGPQGYARGLVPLGKVVQGGEFLKDLEGKGIQVRRLP